MCPICEENKNWKRLEFYQKNLFLGHYRFLNSTHHYPGWRKAFNVNPKHDRAPPLTGDQMFEKVKDMSTQFGKPFAHTLVKGGWKKSSTFW